MEEGHLIDLALVVVLGVTAQWIAWRLGLPSILLLLMCGLAAGPGLQWIDPEALLGDLLLPCVSLAVALILYEGGLSLRMSELPKVSNVFRRLVTVGALVTWLIAGLAAHYVLGLSFSLSALLGAVLIVTGPTVIGPLLRHIRPTGAVGPILKWEGIVIDPIGALMTVLVFEAILIGNATEAGLSILLGILLTVCVGTALGVAAALVLVLLIVRHWIADYLENGVSLMLVVAVFTLSNHIQQESGLWAVTVMGFTLANQKRADVGHIVEFKENLRVLLISSLFIVLAARLDPQSLIGPFGLRSAVFVLILILIARPLSVWVSTLDGKLSRQQRWFLAWMAPRGIVAAAVASVFALRLESEGYADADRLVSVTFMTIIATVAVYGLTAPWVSRKLGVAEANPQGILFVGAHAWVRQLAGFLKEQGFSVLLVDNNREQVSAARLSGVPAYGGSILAEHTLDDLDLGGLGRLLAVTQNEWVNVLAVNRFERIFGRAECYQLSPRQDADKNKDHKYLHGRWLFNEKLTFRKLARLHDEGYLPKATKLSEEFTYEQFLEEHGDKAVPLFIIADNKKLLVLTTEQNIEPQPGHTVISLVGGTRKE